MERKRKLSFGQIVLNKIFGDKKILWGHQLKVFKQLREKYPDDNFWLDVNFGIDIISLEIFNTPYGKTILDKKYHDYHYEPEEVEIDTEESDTKFGEDFKKNNNKKTIRQFLNG